MDLVLPLFEPISNKVLSIGIALIDQCSGQFETKVLIYLACKIKYPNGPPSPNDTILLHAQKICFLLNNVDKKEKNDNANIETFDPIPKN